MEKSEIILANIEEASSVIKGALPVGNTGLVLGSGLGGVVDKLSDVSRLPYSDIPHFPVSGVEGHPGVLHSGLLGAERLLVMQGRFHYYEGYTMQGVTMPVRVMARLGVSRLILTNAAGGLRSRLRPGDFLVVEDHLNFMGGNPLIGDHDPDLGPRFVDMQGAYDPDLAIAALGAARKLGLRASMGVLAGVSGPAYETPAEAAFLRNAGADAVTMSTIPEVIAARHAGLKVLCLSCITNVHRRGGHISHDEVIAVSSRSAEKLALWLKGLFSSW